MTIDKAKDFPIPEGKKNRHISKAKEIAALMNEVGDSYNCVGTDHLRYKNGKLWRGWVSWDYYGLSPENLRRHLKLIGRDGLIDTETVPREPTQDEKKDLETLKNDPYFFSVNEVPHMKFFAHRVWRVR